MAVLAIFKGKMTKSQYEELRKAVNWEGNQPSGAVFHASSFDDEGGIHVADVWESTETLDAFVGQRLTPAMQKMGIGPPEVEIYPAHNINAYPAIQQHRI